MERFAATLSPDAQAVFRLSEVEGLSGPDVAGRLGIPLNTAYSHIRRVRSRLKTVAIAAIVLSLLAISMLAGTCHTEARGDRQRVALRPGAHAPG